MLSEESAFVVAPAKKKWASAFSQAKPNACPLLPLTNEEWEKMSGKARWDSIVALRGPDLIGSDTLKWFTTSVIRYRLGQVMRTGGLVNSHLGFVVLPEGCYTTKSTKPFDVGHFLNHVAEAATWLSVPIAWCSQDIFGKILSGEHYTKVYAVLEKELSDPYKARLRQLLGPWNFPDETLPSNQVEASKCE